MMERITHLLRVRNGVNQMTSSDNGMYSTPLENHVVDIPIFRDDQLGRDMKERDQRWREWSEKLISLYALSNPDARVRTHNLIFNSRPLDGIHIFNALSELGDPLRKGCAFEIFEGVRKIFKEQEEFGFSPDQNNFLRYLNNSQVFSQDIKVGFPMPSDKRDDSFMEIQVDSTSKIILERLLGSDSPKENMDSLVVLLEKIKEGSMPLPMDRRFTIRLLREYKDNKKVRRLIRQIHEKHLEWAEVQTRDWRGKKRRV